MPRGKDFTAESWLDTALGSCRICHGASSSRGPLHRDSRKMEVAIRQFTPPAPRRRGFSAHNQKVEVEGSWESSGSSRSSLVLVLSVVATQLWRRLVMPPLVSYKDVEGAWVMPGVRTGTPRGGNFYGLPPPTNLPRSPVPAMPPHTTTLPGMLPTDSSGTRLHFHFPAPGNREHGGRLVRAASPNKGLTHKLSYRSRKWKFVSPVINFGVLWTLSGRTFGPAAASLCNGLL